MVSTHVQKDFTISLFISNGVYQLLSFQIQQIYRHNGEIPCLDIFNRPYSRTGVSWSGEQRSDKMWLYKESRASLFVLNNRKWKTFLDGKFWVEEIIVL